ncbi:unnamed protein product [Spirodela intermedia]|uniref:Uncharacterized protein n=2 Tax=Spirodela intermedia TaxID=51605 RepID=A0A7I8KC31_SPIIN|nr:unnamed protein product [Spirodela intermedia]CAA6658373.1 unnamed protein product [Spirodela intermedia]CAA7394628.1 unnamed protein product [Spirodela intermedia]
MFPSAMTVSTPDASTSGASLLATHTTVFSGMLLYQIPMYLFSVEFPGEKKPRAKIPPEEVMVWLTKIRLSGCSLLSATQNTQ